MKNQGTKVLAAAAGMLFYIVIGMMIGYNMRSIQAGQYPVYSEAATSSKVERTPVYSRTELHYFKPGDILTTKENGALMLWDTTMSMELIVGIVSDSGTIDAMHPIGTKLENILLDLKAGDLSVIDAIELIEDIYKTSK